MNKNESPYLTLEETAERFGYSKVYFQRVWPELGITAYRPGRKLSLKKRTSTEESSRAQLIKTKTRSGQMNKPNRAQMQNPELDLIERQEAEEYNRQEIRREAESEELLFGHADFIY